jgi:hypothetical protein
MKKTILVFALISIANLTFAQQVRQTNQMFGDPATFSGIKSSTGKVLSYDEILGSPYLDKNFHIAKIAENPEQLPVRYNSYNDEIEFKKDDKILALPKKSEFSRIQTASPKQILVLLETSDELSGYFFELVNGKNSLYQKIKTKFTDYVPAPNGYASDKPATFKTLDPVYYIKTEKGFIKKPKNQRDIIEQFPDKKEGLTTFFKSNKIKFDKEEDLIKLVTYLNQN